MIFLESSKKKFTALRNEMSWWLQLTGNFYGKSVTDPCACNYEPSFSGECNSEKYSEAGIKILFCWR